MDSLILDYTEGSISPSYYVILEGEEDACFINAHQAITCKIGRHILQDDFDIEDEFEITERHLRQPLLLEDSI